MITIKTYQLLLLLASLLTIIPFYDYKNQTIKKSKSAKYYCSIYVLLSIIFQINSLYCVYVQQDYDTEDYGAVTQVIINEIRNVLIFLQSVTSTLGIAFWNRKCWKRLFRNLFNYDLTFSRNTFSYNKFYNILIFVSTIFLVGGIVLNNIIWIKIISTRLQLEKYFPTYYLIIVEHIRTIISFLIIQKIRQLFEGFNNTLKERFTRNRRDTFPRHFENLFRRLVDVVELFNSTHGLQIFLGILQSSTVLMTYLYNGYRQLYRNLLFPYVLFYTSLTVGIFSMVSENQNKRQSKT